MQPVTVSRILLCSTHIVPDTTTPPSDDLDVSLTTSALLENLKAGEDPLNVLDVGPAIHDPVVLSLTFPPPVATSPKVVGPIRRRQKDNSLQGTEDNMYQDVLVEVNNSGDSLYLWCRQIYFFQVEMDRWDEYGGLPLLFFAQPTAQNRLTSCCILERATRRTLIPGSIT